ncbi:MAG: MotA/TolQ/ExbB proton channel family protein [Betaproteobacteria bacterium]|nr:MotA/TolQ/ExbB proton channel family protein [Betaproteobacteria bacterium]
MELIQRAFLYGGWIMYVILFFFICVVALALWRGWLLYYVFDTQNARGMWSEIYKQVANNQIESAIRLCERQPAKQILPRVWKKGLQSASRTAEETQNAIESATLERLPLVNRYLNYFGTLANITTLLGLLGTIAGLIISFSAVATLTGAAKQTKLAEGISHALYATGFGLGTALVAMVVHGLLTFKANQTTETTDEFAAKLIELLQMRRANLTSKSSPE